MQTTVNVLEGFERTPFLRFTSFLIARQIEWRSFQEPPIQDVFDRPDPYIHNVGRSRYEATALKNR